MTESLKKSSKFPSTESSFISQPKGMTSGQNSHIFMNNQQSQNGILRSKFAPGQTSEISKASNHVSFITKDSGIAKGGNSGVRVRSFIDFNV